MEKAKDNTLMKARSYRSVIATALRVYTSTFRQVFKKTWLCTLAYAIVVAIAGTLLSKFGLLFFSVLLFFVAPIAELLIWAACKPLKRMMKAALSHWLLTMFILIVGSIILLLVCLIAALPLIILTTADLTAQVGQLMGDPLGMPSHISALTFFSWFLAAFLQTYVRMTLLFVGYYAYGSAESRKKERQAINL